MCLLRLFLDFNLGLKKNLRMKLFNKTALYFLFLFVILLNLPANSYPSFIGYGYGNCILCHYNGHGNGAITDYGRSVFASEIASRRFYDPKITDEELTEKSGFLGKKPLPWWFRPGFKYRGLYYQINPGSETSISKYITMQADANVAFLFDQDQKTIAVMSFGYYPVSSALKNDPNKPSDWISREHYVRYLAKENLSVFVGLMDKSYGVRTVDHKAYSREKVGVAQNDQTYGVMAIFKKEPWEFTPHVFIGNLAQNSELRQKGFSFMAEKDLTQFHRVGSSLMISENNYTSWLRLGAHSKLGFGKGNSFIFESGIIQNKPKTGDIKNGGYVFAESVAIIERGYFFLSQLEYYNETLSTKSNDNLKWTLGFLTFPLLKTELRFTIVNGRSINDASVNSDTTSAQLQLHLSL